MQDATSTRRRVTTSIAFAFVALGYAAGALAWAPSGNDGIHRAASMRAPMLLRRPIFERRSELATSRSAGSDRPRQERSKAPRGDARGTQGHDASPLILVPTGNERHRGSRTPYGTGGAGRAETRPLLVAALVLAAASLALATEQSVFHDANAPPLLL